MKSLTATSSDFATSRSLLRTTVMVRWFRLKQTIFGLSDKLHDFMARTEPNLGILFGTVAALLLLGNMLR